MNPIAAYIRIGVEPLSNEVHNAMWKHNDDLSTLYAMHIWDIVDICEALDTVVYNEIIAIP
jgi:hypothetical protein